MKALPVPPEFEPVVTISIMATAKKYGVGYHTARGWISAWQRDNPERLDADAVAVRARSVKYRVPKP